ncbi:MAG: histidine phosphotransferase [Desulfobulbus propionicus]|nr:MAG: histidine phosphotransferase [Desulfobulbus propionicus]
MGLLQWNKEFALEQTGGDEELLDELIILFQDSSAADLKQLKAAITARDTDGIVAAAHSLKGAAASLGIEAVRDLALQIETNARAGELAGMEGQGTFMGELLAELAKYH